MYREKPTYSYNSYAYRHIGEGGKAGTSHMLLGLRNAFRRFCLYTLRTVASPSTNTMPAADDLALLIPRIPSLKKIPNLQL
jgi:hypothetical protein